MKRGMRKTWNGSGRGEHDEKESHEEEEADDEEDERTRSFIYFCKNIFLGLYAHYNYNRLA